MRSLAHRISAGDASIVFAFALPKTGLDGCDRTGATTEGSVIIASAYPPVKHMPTAPTPLPPHSACALRASARHQSTIGLDFPFAHTLNSRAMQMALKISPKA